MRALATRLLRLVAVLIAVTAASYSMVSLLPGDTVSAVLGANSTQEAREEARAQLRLDDPLPVRYGHWVADALQGDLGRSYKTKQEDRKAHV